MTDNIIILGLVCIVAAITGGGLEAIGVKLPIISSPKRQIALGVFGSLLLVTAERDPILEFLRDLFPIKRDITASLNAGVGENAEVPCSDPGAITVRLNDLVPARNSSNNDYLGVHVRICPPSGGTDCPWRQLAMGQSFRSKCTESGDYNINIFNFENSPHVELKAVIEYSR